MFKLFLALALFAATANAGIILTSIVPKIPAIENDPSIGAEQGSLVSYPNGAEVPAEPAANQAAKANHLTAKAIAEANAALRPVVLVGGLGVHGVVGAPLVGHGLVGAPVIVG